MTEPLAAVLALERLLARMDSDVLLQVVFELKRLVAFGTLKLTQLGALLVANHVPLQAVDIGECLAANFADLRRGRVQRNVLVEVALRQEADAALRTGVFRRLRPVGGVPVLLEQVKLRVGLIAVWTLGQIFIRITWSETRS